MRQLTSGNAAAVYDIDLDQLQPLADRFGPTPELVARPLSPGELDELSGLGVFRSILGDQREAERTPG